MGSRLAYSKAKTIVFESLWQQNLSTRKQISKAGVSFHNALGALTAPVHWRHRPTLYNQQRIRFGLSAHPFNDRFRRHKGRADVLETDHGVASADRGISACPATGESLHSEARCSVWRKRIADMTRTAPRQRKVSNSGWRPRRAIEPNPSYKSDFHANPSNRRRPPHRARHSK